MVLVNTLSFIIVTYFIHTFVLVLSEPSWAHKQTFLKICRPFWSILWNNAIFLNISEIYKLTKNQIQISELTQLKQIEICADCFVFQIKNTKNKFIIIVIVEQYTKCALKLSKSLYKAKLLTPYLNYICWIAEANK